MTELADHLSCDPDADLGDPTALVTLVRRRSGSPNDRVAAPEIVAVDARGAGRGVQRRFAFGVSQIWLKRISCQSGGASHPRARVIAIDVKAGLAPDGVSEFSDD